VVRRLKQPGAPCLSVGSSNKPVWLPAEVCRIRPGQRKLKLDDKQTAEARRLSLMYQVLMQLNCR